MARKQSVKTVKNKYSPENPVASARTGQIGGTIPQARTGGLGTVTANVPAANPSVTAMAPSANPQMAAATPVANPQIAAMSTPQVPTNAPLPNNVSTQQAVAATPPAVSAVPRKTAKVKSVKKKEAQIAQASEQPSNQAMMQEASPAQQGQGNPSFNFFFAGKTPF